MALLKQYDTDFGTIRVTQAHDGSLAYYQNGSFHSQINKDGVSVCTYVHVIHEIIRQSHAHNILIIGCAGGSLATMLRRLHCKVTTVDINPLAFAIARRHFFLPDDVRCVRRDGITYLRTTHKHYDAVIIDVFGSNNAVPPKFTTKSFFHKVEKILSPCGLVIMNIITANDKDLHADKIACHMQSLHKDITLFDWPGQKDRNTLIVGGLPQRVHIPSGAEPKWIKEELGQVIRRKPWRHTLI
jgi:predicted membrane-bound spermidine synthase